MSLWWKAVYLRYILGGIWLFTCKCSIQGHIFLNSQLTVSDHHGNTIQEGKRDALKSSDLQGRVSEGFTYWRQHVAQSSWLLDSILDTGAFSFFLKTRNFSQDIAGLGSYFAFFFTFVFLLVMIKVPVKTFPSATYVSINSFLNL